MSSKDKAREKLMSSMRKTKDNIKEEVLADEPVTGSVSSSKESKQPEKKAVKETVEKITQNRDEQKKNEVSKTDFFKSKRVWPD